MTSLEQHRRDQSGQALVVFALSLVAIMATLGLVIDGGSASAHRRSVQNAADLAALAGADNYLVNHSSSQARTAARTSTAKNGYTNGSGGVTVSAWIKTGEDTDSEDPPDEHDSAPHLGTQVRVTVSTPHRNFFAGIVGQGSWTVAATATALTGVPNTALGAGPFIFSIDAFYPGSGLPKYTLATDFGEANGDIPVSAEDIAWTNYGTGNVDSNEVRSIIDGSEVVDITLDFGTYIGQYNNGFHNTLFDAVDTHLAGKTVPIPVVDHAGNFMGWATFHVVSATSAGSKHINGYFVSPYFSEKLTIKQCAPVNCHGISGGFGSYVVKLVN
jgi:Flp pilus assembly protein TadG